MSKRGRPAHEPTKELRRQIEALVAYGTKQAAICEIVGLSENTVRKYYAQELETGTAKANAKVAESLFQKALGDSSGSVAAAIFWMKSRAGWKETQAHELGGAGGGPVVLQKIVETKPGDA